MTHDDALRAEAIAFLESLTAYNQSIMIATDDIGKVVARFKAQRAAEVKAFQQRIEEHHAKDHWYFKSLKNWLDQRAKEWET